MAVCETSGESANTGAGVEKMSVGNRELPPPGPPVLISDTGIGIERKRREAREEWEKARARRGRWGSGDDGSAPVSREQERVMADANAAAEPEAIKDSPAADQYPPPGPTNWVTDGYPHRETDPRNWRANGGYTRESGSPSPRGRLKEILDRWLR